MTNWDVMTKLLGRILIEVTKGGQFLIRVW